MCGCRPVVLSPQYCVRDFYTTRMVPVIQPVVQINRQNIINVPQRIVQPMTRNVVVDQGCPGAGGGMAPGFPGMGMGMGMGREQGFPETGMGSGCPRCR